MVTWKTEELFNDPHRFFDAVIKAINEANYSVHFETYIFLFDELGTRVAHALIAAAKRGVRVYAMVDGFGSPDWLEKHYPQLRSSGVKCRVFNPLPWALFGPVFLRRKMGLGAILTAWRRMNERNHRKSCIVDRQTAFIGGMNVAAEHLNWRDTGVRVQGSGVNDILQAFQSTWAQAWAPDSRKTFTRNRVKRYYSQNYLVRLNIVRRLRKRGFDELIQKIISAQTRVWVTTAYFIPPRQLVRAMKYVASKGTDVRILLPAHPDIPGIKTVAASFYHGLCYANVRIYEYHPTVLHAKTLLIDESAMVGSSNLNHRSFWHDLEIDVILSKPESVRELSQAFIRDLENSKEITDKDWKELSIFQRALAKVLLLLRGNL